MTKKNMTIEDLAQMIKRGFDETATKAEIQHVDERLTTLEHRVTELGQHMTGLEQNVADGFAHVNARLDRIRDDIADLPAIREELKDLRQRVERLERTG